MGRSFYVNAARGFPVTVFPGPEMSSSSSYSDAALPLSPRKTGNHPRTMVMVYLPIVPTRKVASYSSWKRSTPKLRSISGVVMLLTSMTPR